MRSPTRGIWLAGVSFLTVTLFSASAQAQSCCSTVKVPTTVVQKPSQCSCGDNTGSCKGFTIGLSVHPIPDMLKSQLKTGGFGLLVTCATVDRPAQKVDIRRDDILLMAGDRDLYQVADLIDAIDGAKGNGIQLTVLRKGVKLPVITVTPEPRCPQAAAEAALGDLKKSIDGINASLETLKTEVAKIKKG